MKDLKLIRHLVLLPLCIPEGTKRHVNLCEIRKQESDAEIFLQFQHVRVKSARFVAVVVYIKIQNSHFVRMRFLRLGKETEQILCCSLKILPPHDPVLKCNWLLRFISAVFCVYAIFLIYTLCSAAAFF